MASKDFVSYHISLTLVSATNPTTVLYGDVVPITEEDLKLGIPARVTGRVNMALADLLQSLTAKIRREREAQQPQPGSIETVNLQEGVN